MQRTTTQPGAGPDPRAGRTRARCSLLPVLALLLGALSLFAAAPVAAQVIAPSVPQNVRATPGNNSITLNWETPSSWGTWSAVGFEVQHNVDAAFHYLPTRIFNSVGSSSRTSLTMPRSVYRNHNAPLNGQSYSLRIRAVSKDPDQDGSDNSHFRYSSWVTVTDIVPGLPAAIASSALTVTSGDAKLDLSWTAPSNNGSAITGYDVHYTSAAVGTAANDAAVQTRRSATAATGWLAVSRTGTAASQAVTGLIAGTKHRVRVRARNTHGAGAWVFGSGRTEPNRWQFSPASYSLYEGVPARLRITLSVPAPAGGLTFTLTPLFGTDVPATTVRRGCDLTTTRAARADLGTSLPATVTVQAGKTEAEAAIPTVVDALEERDECFAVRAATTASDWAVVAGPQQYDVAHVTIFEKITTAPTGLTAATAHQALNLSWTAPPEAVAGYDVHYTSAAVGKAANDAAAQTGGSPSAANGWVAVNRSGTAASQSITGLTNGRAYRVRVRAKNRAGNSPWAFGTGTPLPQVRFVGQTHAMGETETQDIEVTLGQALASSTTVRLRIVTANSSAAEKDDFTLSSKTLTFAPGDTTQIVRVAGVADRTAEGVEAFTLELVAVNDAPYALGRPSRAEVVIFDDSQPSSLALELTNRVPRPDSIDEGESKDVFAVLSSQQVAPEGGATVTFSLGTGTATESTDFTLSTKSVTIAAGDTSNGHGTVVLKALHDGVNDHGETVVINAAVTLGGETHTATKTVTIVQTAPTGLGVTSGAGRLDLAWTASSAVTAGGYDVHYTSASKAGSSPVADDAAVQTGGSPSAANGWVAVNRSGTAASQSVTGLTNGQAYRVRVRTTFPFDTSSRAPSGWVLGGGTPLAQVRFVGHTHAMGETETQDVDVTLSQALAFSTTVRLRIDTANSSATETDDFTLSTKTLTFAPGDTTQTVTVTGVADKTTEWEEAFTLELVAVNDAPYALAKPSKAEVVIFDDSQPSSLALELTSRVPRPHSIDEGESKELFALLSSQQVAPEGGATVTFTLGSGTAAESTDFTLSTKSVTIAEGDTSNGYGTVVLKALHDSVNDHGETVVINAAVTLGGETHAATKTVTIVQTAPTGLGVTPGAGKLNLAWTAPSAVTPGGYDVHYTSASKTGQGAVADDAAVQTGGSRSAANGWVAVDRSGTAASQSITGLASGQAYRVRVRTTFPFDTSARGPSGWVFGTAAQQQAAAQQQTDTTGPSAPAFVPGGGSAVTDAGTNITLTFTEAVKKDAQNADFTGHGDLSAILTLARTHAGGTAIAYTASINADKTVITLDPTDDLADGAVYVGISGAYYDTSGNAGTAAGATFTVATPRTPTQSSDTNLSALTASTHTGFDGTSTALNIGTFSASTTSYTAAVPYAAAYMTLTPTVADAGKATVKVGRQGSTLAPVPRGSGSGAFALSVGSNAITVRVTAEDGTTKDYTVTVTRQAQTQVSPTVTLSSSPSPVQEGVTVIVKATLSSPAPQALAFPVTVTRGSAEAQDLGTLPTTIRIARGEWRGTANLATRKDDDEDDETFTVALDTANLPSGIAAGAVTSVDVTILDITAAVDTATVDLSYSPRRPVKAGDSATITGTLSHALSGDVTIPLTLKPDDGATSADYGTLPSIRIAAGETRGSVTLATVRDGDDHYQSARVLLGDLPAEVARGPRWWVRVTIEPRPIAIVWLSAPETVNEGETVTVTAHLTETLAEAVRIPVTATFGNGPAASHEIPVAAGASSGTLDVPTRRDDDSADERLVVQIDTRRLVEVDPQVRIEGPSRERPTQIVISVLDLPALTAQGGSAREGQDEAAVFTVRLSYAATDTVTVGYATANAAGAWQGAAPATAGADYITVSGTLIFAVGETTKTVSVPVLDDAVDEGTEHFLLRFSNPQGGYVQAGHGEAHGLITNDDPLQAMWLARFGRTVGSQVTDAVAGRLDSRFAPGAHATLAGQPLGLTQAGDGTALADTMSGLARAFGAAEAPAPDDDPFGRLHDAAGAWNDPAAARSITGRELLLGSSFHLATEGEGSAPHLAAWGRVAQGSFDADQASGGGRTSVDGEVVTGTLGADADFGRILAGVAVSLSEGSGTFDSLGVDVGTSGGIESTLTTVSPYLRFRLTEQVSAWGLVGWGTGDVTFRFDDGAMAAIRTDIGMQLGALGAKGVLMEQVGAGAMDLALKADVFFVRMDSEAAANAAAASADASRLRLVLEGGRAFSLSQTTVLRPSLELGLRHDGGGAETGTGLELGGGVTLVNAAWGFSLDARLRMLVAHADSAYREWGASLAARLDPGERGRGPMFSVNPTFGSTASAAERLWGAQDARTLAADGGAFQGTAGGLQAEAGYGLAMRGGRLTGTPNVGFAMSEGGARDWRVGWRVTSAVQDDLGFEVNLDAVRREPADDNGPVDHGVMLRGGLRW